MRATLAPSASICRKISSCWPIFIRRLISTRLDSGLAASFFACAWA